MSENTGKEVDDVNSIDVNPAKVDDPIVKDAEDLKINKTTNPYSSSRRNEHNDYSRYDNEDFNMAPSYYERSRYKKRRIVTSSGRRRDDNVDNRKIDNGRVPKKGKPVWMSDADYEKQQESVTRAINPKFKEEKISNVNINENENLTNENLTNETKIVEPMASDDINVKMKYLKTLKSEGKDEIVREFYNTQTFHSRRSKRNESPIYRLRSFNNCIKYILINKYGKPGGSVLELGCGKGGDLSKWGMVGTRQFVGIDLSDESIREAIKRYRNGRYDFQAVFATGDAFNVELPEILSQFSLEEVSYLQFDNVSMQFCMHYAFSSEKNVLNMLKNVSRSLKVGGMFVGTIPSSDFIKWKIKKLLKQKDNNNDDDSTSTTGKGWGNSLYSVTFPDLGCYDAEKDGFIEPFGNVYNYYLKDAVDNVPEYVVPFEKFRSMCEEHGLELRYKKNFFDMFNKEVGHFFNKLPGPLVQSLSLPDGSGRYGVVGEEREACSFYLAFAFERV